MPDQTMTRAAVNRRLAKLTERAKRHQNYAVLLEPTIKQARHDLIGCPDPKSILDRLAASIKQVEHDIPIDEDSQP